MGSDSEAALRGVETKKAKYGEDHFSKIGALGGQASLGRHHSAATKKKISRTKRRQAREDNSTPT